ncbi:MAG: TonB-dependent receptor [Acidobacteriota bacterium]
MRTRKASHRTKPVRETVMSVVWAFLFCVSSSYAQVERGTIAGTVHDPSGAAAPNVAIAVTNVATGVDYKTRTNESGEFVAPNLIPGEYAITAALTGFKTLQRRGIVLQVNGRVAVALTLEVGEVTQEVEVTAAAPLLQSEASALGTVIARRDISELPLNGRSVFNLAPLTAGVTTGIASINANNANIPDNARASQGLSVNGQAQSANTYILDGVYNNQINQGLIAILPPLEAIQEFTVETSNFNAEIGRGGGVVNVTLKSGTNEIHGQMFEFHRNAALDARNFFDRRTAASSRRLPNFVQNQYGFALGGPLIKNRTFWFGDYQGTRSVKGNSFVTTVPGPNIRNGDFRGLARPIFDPTTYDPVTRTRSRFATDGVIDPSRFSNAAKNILRLLPPSNDPTGAILANGEALFFSDAPRVQYQDSFDIKIDHRFSDKDSFSGRFSYGRSDTTLPGPFLNVPGSEPLIGQAAGTGGAGSLNGQVSNPSRSLALQEIHNFSPTTLNEFRAAYIRAGSDALQLNFGKNFADEVGIPGVNVTDNNSGFPGINISGYSPLGDSAFFPLIELENIYQVLDNATFIRGSHTYKVGVDYKRIQRNFTQILGAPAGSFVFGGGFTANPAQPGGVTGNAFADFLMGLTTSGNLIRNSGLAGLRQSEFSTYWQDTWKVNQKLTLNYGIRYDLITPQTEAYDRQTNFDRGTGKLVLPNGGGSHPGFSTRALALTDKNNFAPRFGFAYKLSENTVIRSSYGVFFLAQGQVGFQLTLNAPFVGGLNYVNTPDRNIVVRTLDQGIPISDPFSPITNPQGTLNGLDPENRTGYAQQYSLSIQRQLSPTVLFDVSYVGNSSFHLQDQYNLQQPFPGTAPVATRRPYFATIPNVSGFNYLENRLNSSYHALQATLTKRFSGGLSFMTNYTWSHGIGFISGPFGAGGGHQNARDLNADRGNSLTDVRHRYIANWLYELPFGKGKPFLSNSHAVVNGILGDWQLGGVVTIQSGSPFTVSGGLGRPNRTCDGKLPRGERGPDRWFDAGCFPLPAPVADPVAGGVFTPFGNSGTAILAGPGISNVDISFFKSIPVSEGKKFEFRSEFFNAFNNSQFLNPNGAILQGTTARILAARPSRQIQMVLKFIF